MFYKSKFNGDISNWNLSNLTHEIKKLYSDIEDDSGGLLIMYKINK